MASNNETRFRRSRRQAPDNINDPSVISLVGEIIS